MRCVFVVDTNLFLQCRDVKSLPWDSITSANQIVVLISRPVQEEIDRLKSDGNSRRARRSRLANSLFREIVKAPDMGLAVKCGQATVVFSFAPDYQDSELRSVGDWADLGHADHVIVASALLFQKASPDDHVVLLTDDTMPLLTAKRYSLEYRKTPEDWLLSPEPDDRDKRMGALETEIEKLKRRQPVAKIDFMIEMQGGPEISLSIDKLQEASPDELSELLTRIKGRWQLQSIFPESEADLPRNELIARQLIPVAFAETYVPPTRQQITEYQSLLYPRWIKEVEEWLLQAQAILVEDRKRISGVFLVENQGEAPLENCVVELDAYDGALFLPPCSEESESDLPFLPNLPRPPVPPRGHWKKPYLDRFGLMGISELAESMSPKMDLSNLPLLLDRSITPISKAKDKFYWSGEMPSSPCNRWVFECDLFRHKTEAEAFEVSLYIPAECRADQVSIRCRVSGSNLYSPVEYFAKVHLMFGHAKASDLLRAEIEKICN